MKASTSQTQYLIPYVVNNYLQTILQPKRNLQSLKIFLQLQRKRARTALIERRFHQSFESLQNQAQQTRRGFMGCAKGRRAERNPFLTTFKRTMTENNQLFGADKQRWKGPRWPTKKYQKPNLMYNLSLYRRKKKPPANVTH